MRYVLYSLYQPEHHQGTGYSIGSATQNYFQPASKNVTLV